MLPTRSIGELRAALESGAHPRLAKSSRSEKQAWIESFVRECGYADLNREERGVARAYIQAVTGYSRAQMTRYVGSIVPKAVVTAAIKRDLPSVGRFYGVVSLTSLMLLGIVVSLPRSAPAFGSLAFLNAEGTVPGVAPLHAERSIVVTTDAGGTGNGEVLFAMERTPVRADRPFTALVAAANPGELRLRVEARRQARIDRVQSPIGGRGEQLVDDSATANGADFFAAIGSGRDGQVLTVKNGKIVWAYPNFSGTGRAPTPENNGNDSDPSNDDRPARRGGGGGGGGSESTGGTTTNTTVYQTIDSDEWTDATGVVYLTDVSLNVGIGTTTPGAKLEVVGSISGSSLKLAGLANCNTIDTDAAGNLICGTDEGGVAGSTEIGTASFSGGVLRLSDARYVNTSGDTMTGALTIDLSGTNAGVGLEVIETISGSVLYANRSLASSGSLVWEGAASGASLYVASSLNGAGLVDCDIAGSSKLLWDAATGRFSCGTDADTNTSYTAGKGLALNDTSFSLNDTITGALVRFNTVSGSTIYARSLLAASGSLAVDGTAYLNAASPLKLTNAGFFGCTALETDADGDIVCGSDADTDTNTTYTAGQGLSLNGTVLSIGSTISGSLLEFQTVSGGTVFANRGLSSSGALVTEGGATFGGNLVLNTNLVNNESSITFTTDDGDESVYYNNIDEEFQFTGSLWSPGNIRLNGGIAAGDTSTFSAAAPLKLTNAGFFGCTALETDADGDIVCGSDDAGGGSMTAGQGLALNGSVLRLGSTISGSLLEFQTVSGSLVYASKTLASSGSLTWEGPGSGASLYIGGTFEGAGLTDCDTDGQSLSWDATARRFVCGDDDTGGSSYTAGQGLALNGSVLVLNSTISGSLLEFQTVSGAIVHANALLRSSGSLIVESNARVGGTLDVGGSASVDGTLTTGDFIFAGGNLSTEGTLHINSDGSDSYVELRFGAPDRPRSFVFDNTIDDFVLTDSLSASGSLFATGTLSGSAIRGLGLSDCDADNQTLHWDASTGRFSCGDDDTGGSSVTAGQGLTLNGSVLVLNSTITGSLLEFQTVSGALVYAKNTLASSGALAVDGTASFNASAPLKLTSAGFFGCTALETDADGDIVCGSDADTNTTYTAGQGLSLNGTSISLNATITGSLLEFQTVSGSTVYGSKSLRSSGSLVWEGAGSGASLYIGGTFEGAGLSDCDADGQALSWDATAKRFVCGDDDSAGSGLDLNTADLRYVNQHGDTMTGALRLLNTALNVTGSGTFLGYDTADVVLTVRGASGQTGNLQEWRDGNDSLVLFVDDEGLLSGSSAEFSGNVVAQSNVTLGSDNADAVTFNGDVVSHLTPDTNNSFDLGNATNRWATGYFANISAAGNVTVDDSISTGGLNVSASTVLGDDSLDELTFNGATVTFAIDTNVVLTGGTDGLSFDGDTLSIDAGNNRIGIGTSAPRTALEVIGTVSGSTVITRNLSITDVFDCYAGLTTAMDGTVTCATNAPMVGIGSGVNSGTPGSVLFVDGGSALAEDVSFVWNDSLNILDIGGTVSGSTLYAKNSLRSSGSLVWEGAGSGASLYIGGTFEGAGLSDCDADGQALSWDATAKRFVCGDDDSGASGIQSHYVLASGDTMTGSLVIDRAGLRVFGSGSFTSSDLNDVVLVVRGTGSQVGLLQEWRDNNNTQLAYVSPTGNIGTAGSIFVGNDSSDYLYIAADVNSSFNPDSNNSYSLGNSSNRWATGWFNNLNVSDAVSVLGTSSFTGNVGVGPANTTTRATLSISGVASGTTVYATRSFSGAGLSDCDADNQTLHWDATTGRFSCGDDDTGGAAGLVDHYVLASGDTMTGALIIDVNGGTNETLGLEVINTISGSIVYVTDYLSGPNSTIDVAGHLLPTLDGFFTLGTDAKEWYQLYSNWGVFSMGLGVGTETASSQAKLEVGGTASGRVLFANDSLRSSGALVWEGAASGKSLFVSGTSILHGGLEVIGAMSGTSLAINGGMYVRGGNGDVNGDGSSTAVDLLLLIDYFNGAGSYSLTPEQFQRADVNGDGEVDTFDYYFINANGLVDVSENIEAKFISDTAFAVDLNGNVGIGTDAPGTKLEVIGTISGALIRQSGPGTNYFRGNVGIGQTAADAALDVLGTISGSALTVNGNVGIGLAAASTTQALHIKGDNEGLRIEDGSSTEGYDIARNDSTGYLEFTGSQNNFSGYRFIINDTEEAVTFLNSGNVGIGNATPNAELDVVGTISGSALKVADSVYVGKTTGAGKIIAQPPVTQTVTGGATITDNACGTVKELNAGSSVTTNTTNTFTAPSAANDGCIMYLVNVDAVDTITLDANANFETLSGIDVSLTALDTVIVVSNGTTWYQMGYNATNNDIAEWIPYSGDKPQAGDVLAIADDEESVRVATSPYDAKIIGVVSTAPGVVMGKSADSSVLLALAGRVPVKVTGEGGPIAPGDLLTSSSTPGHAMKATRGGPTVGKALAAFDGNGTGSVLAFVNVASYGPAMNAFAIVSGSGTAINAVGTAAQMVFTSTDADNRALVVLDSEETTATQDLLVITSDVGSDENTVFKVTADGNAYSDEAFHSAGADYAEWFRVSTNDLKPGDVVCVDVTRSNTVKRCDQDGDGNVMGIVSTNPAFIGNSISGAQGLTPPGYALIGLIGQVPAKVRVENDEAIRAGDSLTAASIPGYARKALPGESTVGVALEPLESGEGVVNVLISRRNQSLTVSAIEQKVLDQIQAMEIGDEVELMVAEAMGDLDVEQSIVDEVARQVDSLNVPSVVEQEVSRQVALLREEMSASAPAASTGALSSDLVASTLQLSASLSVEGDARIVGDLHLDGALVTNDLFVPGVLAVDGSLTASTVDVTGDASVHGTLTLHGPVVLGSGASLQFGSGLTLNDLIVERSLAILGDITVDGMARFLGTVAIEGELVVARQAGHLRVPLGATGATFAFVPPFAGTPVVTASPNKPVLYAVSVATSTGFTISLAEPAASDITFSWVALIIPGTPGAIVETPSGMAFPVDETGTPVSSSLQWNACLRGVPLFDASGVPFSCSRYHDGNTWHQPDLNVSFVWNDAVTPPYMQLPDGYVATVTETSASVRAAITEVNAQQEPAPEPEQQAESVETPSVGTGAVAVPEQPVVEEAVVAPAETPVEPAPAEESADEPAADMPVAETPTVEEGTVVELAPTEVVPVE